MAKNKQDDVLKSTKSNSLSFLDKAYAVLARQFHNTNNPVSTTSSQDLDMHAQNIKTATESKNILAGNLQTAEPINKTE